MNLEVSRVAIMQHIDAVLAAELPTMSVMRENQRFDYPSPPALFARLSIIPAETHRQNLGGDRSFYRANGHVLVEFFAPENTGMQASYRAVDKLELSLTDQVIIASDCSKIVFRQARRQVDGVRDGWYRTTVYVAYYHDIMVQTT